MARARQTLITWPDHSFGVAVIDPEADGSVPVPLTHANGWLAYTHPSGGPENTLAGQMIAQLTVWPVMRLNGPVRLTWDNDAPISPGVLAACLLTAAVGTAHHSKSPGGWFIAVQQGTTITLFNRRRATQRHLASAVVAQHHAARQGQPTEPIDVITGLTAGQIQEIAVEVMDRPNMTLNDHRTRD